MTAQVRQPGRANKKGKPDVLRGDQHCAPKRAVGEDKAKSLLAKNAGRQYPLRVPVEGLKLNPEPPLGEVT